MAGADSWRVTAAILDVAVLAGIGVEQRSQAIAGGGGGWGDHPGVAKEAIADAKVQAAAGRQVGRRQGKRIYIAALDGGRACGQRFARLGAGEIQTGGV